MIKLFGYTIRNKQEEKDLLDTMGLWEESFLGLKKAYDSMEVQNENLETIVKQYRNQLREAKKRGSK